jgi:hypothetical protein
MTTLWEWVFRGILAPVCSSNDFSAAIFTVIMDCLFFDATIDLGRRAWEDEKLRCHKAYSSY